MSANEGNTAAYLMTDELQVCNIKGKQQVSEGHTQYNIIFKNIQEQI